MTCIRIGPGGTAGLGCEAGLKKVSELGLDALEVEFTHGVNLSNDSAKKIGKLAKKLKISLSCHAPYFINLASDEKAKVNASKIRILQSCERMHNMGGGPVVFHPGFYQKKTKEETYSLIKKEVQRMMKTIKEKKWNAWLALETTGKHSAFGSLDELLALTKEIRCSLTIDFAHLKARSQGRSSYGDMLDKVKHLKHIHSHFSGIEWTEKGERKHLLTPEKEIKVLLAGILKRKLDITIINESPDVIGDAYKMKAMLKRMVR
ncbi:TIM barrel protein [Candidatus Woesearchaeota archaeon]|nr:TIM barrel protein [Candidatus Woesearchaeota archaeon]